MKPSGIVDNELKKEGSKFWRISVSRGATNIHLVKEDQVIILEQRSESRKLVASNQFISLLLPNICSSEKIS